MRKKSEPYDPSAPFQTIRNAARTTGLSQYYLRRGCQTGTFPFVRSGNTYYLNMPALFRLLNGTSPEGNGDSQEREPDSRGAGEQDARPDIGDGALPGAEDPA